jgi:predicted PurR-regulated permease PerM
VQQLEGNVLRPKIQGDRLKIHPLVIIFMVIIFVIIFGFLGSLFAVPAYVILRIIFQEFEMKERIFN